MKEKLFSLPKTRLIPVLVVGLVVAGVAGAQLVTYLSNTLSAPTTVESPIELDESTWHFSPLVAGDEHFMLVTLTNKSKHPITGRPEFKVKFWNERTGGNWWNFNGEGICFAISEDIEYAFHREHNPDNIGWKQWMEQNWDWFDWVVGNFSTENYSTICEKKMTEEMREKYAPMYDDVPVGTTVYCACCNDEMCDTDYNDIDNNPDVTPVDVTWENGRILFPEVTIEPGTWHAVVKIKASPNLEPGHYQFDARIVTPGD